MTAAAPPSRPATSSPWDPFRHAAFRLIWLATLVANVGYWMYSAASSWLMTNLDPSPLLVSMVQVATSLPIFLLALPAGALVDIFDRRRFLIAGESVNVAMATAFAAIVWLHWVTPLNLLLFAFLVGAGSAITAPAWQAIVPQLVPKAELAAAESADSVGINISRAIGPGLGGAITVAYGIAAPFAINALTNLGIVAALLWWREPVREAPRLPPEHFANAMRTGLRHARYNAPLRATLRRSTGFFLFASAYWALLPLVARNEVAGGAALYGVLLGAIGVGAVAGAMVLPHLHAALGSDRLVSLGTLGTALALLLFALAHAAAVAILASLIAGASWIVVVTSLNVSAQVALPDWVRGRGLAMFVTVFYGALAIGSALWGQVADLTGVPIALAAAAIGAVVVMPLMRRWKLQTAVGLDLTPSMDWPMPLRTPGIAPDRGPVLVITVYTIDPKRRAAFLKAIAKLARARYRTGAHDWGTYEDPTSAGRFVETFQTDSWLEHLRQHERVTHADRAVQKAVDDFQLQGAPKVSYLLAADIDRP